MKHEVDVVVVGGGAAGLACAVAAAEGGAAVTLVEKGASPGGTTAYSVGSLTAAGTSLQRAAGIEDHPDGLLEDMWDYPDPGLRGDAPDLRRLYADESAPTLEWLVRHGVQFTTPYQEPPHQVPRMHNVVPSSRSYIARLHEAARSAGVDLRLSTAVTGLERDGDRVVGVRLRGPQGEDVVHARRGVVLATGDFSGNAAMRREHLSADAAAALPVNPAADGAGHALASSVGGAFVSMDRLFGPQLRFGPAPRPGLLDRLPMWRWLCALEGRVVRAVPPSALRPVVKSLLVTHMSPTDDLFRSGAILVDSTGSRFGTEEAPAAELAHRPGGRGFLVLDHRIADLFDGEPHFISTAPGIAFAYFTDYRRGRPDLVHRADDAASLAAAIGADPARLEEAVASSELQAPYVALGPVFSMLTVTEGAVKVDDRLRVLREDGTAIEGLHAIGAVGQGGMLLKGHGHHIGWAMTSGRVLGLRLAVTPPAAVDASAS